jgi:hypothetical protein
VLHWGVMQNYFLGDRLVAAKPRQTGCTVWRGFFKVFAGLDQAATLHHTGVRYWKNTLLAVSWAFTVNVLSDDTV